MKYTVSTYISGCAWMCVHTLLQFTLWLYVYEFGGNCINFSLAYYAETSSSSDLKKNHSFLKVSRFPVESGMGARWQTFLTS